MYYLGLFLLIYGIVLILGLLLKFPFMFKSSKAKAFIKLIGLTGYRILLIVLAIAFIVIGILLIT